MPTQVDVQVQRADATHQNEIAETLALAFAEDPVFNWFIRTGTQRDDAVQRVFRSQTRRYLAEGHAYRSEDGRGATLWLPPVEPEQARLPFSFDLLRRQARISGWPRLPRFRYLMRLAQSTHPRDPHYYLYAIGVRPEFKGKGLGGALMRAGLDWCDAEGLPAYLENSNPRNLPFYQRHGFEVMSEVRLPFGGPPLWFMWRKSRSGEKNSV